MKGCRGNWVAWRESKGGWTVRVGEHSYRVRRGLNQRERKREKPTEDRGHTLLALSTAQW